jgi:SAM-dependent methyltransferase
MNSVGPARPDDDFFARLDVDDDLASATAPAPRAPADVLESFTTWCRAELFTPTIVKAEDLVQRCCDAELVRVFRRLRLDRLTTPHSAEEISIALAFEASAPIALDAILRRLAQRSSLVVEDPPDSGRYRGLALPDDPVDRLAKLWLRAAALGDGYLTALEFLDFGTEHFEEALRDDPDLVDRVLSGKEPKYADLWRRATNVDPLQDLHGRMAGRAALALFGGGVVLEIGGGTGNGTRHFLREHVRSGRLRAIERYVFTDVSIPFVLSTRRAITKVFPSLPTSWQFLDVNQPFAKQKIAPRSADLVYGVNAAHVARDVVGFLEECRAALRPGGRVVFGERVRLRPGEMAPRELTLNLSRYHRTAALRDPDVRPDHGYLCPEHWLRALDRAGFADAQILPDLEAVARTFPNRYAAVVTAVAPGA